MAEVAAGFLGDAIDAGVKDSLSVPAWIATRRWLMGGTVGVIVKIGRNALLPKGDGMAKERVIIVKHGDGHHAVNHAEFPVAVTSRPVLDHGLNYIAQHVLKGLNIRR